MNRPSPFRHVSLSAALLACALTSFAYDDAGKNVADAIWTSLPADAAGAVKAIPARQWDFGFRKYGSSAGMLWTDPIAQRDVMSGASSNKEGRVTSLAVTCNEDGFTVLVLCGEPSLATYLAEGKKFPSPGIEFFFMPGDADQEKIEEYWMGYASGERDVREYSFFVPRRANRKALPYITYREQVYGGSILVRLSFDWLGAFDRLPLFGDRRDNFWRLSLIRWADGGMTWGGVVHQAGQAGYIRWPEFTEAQRLAIEKGVLRKCWEKFQKETASPELGLGFATKGDEYAAVGKAWYPAPNPGRYAVERAEAEPQSHVLYAEDPGFRPIMRDLLESRLAIGPRIAEMDAMAPTERDAFYLEASQALFNFRYDLEEKYREYQMSLLMEGK
jgi:hypothetical protein